MGSRQIGPGPSSISNILMVSSSMIMRTHRFEVSGKVWRGSGEVWRGSGNGDDENRKHLHLLSSHHPDQAGNMISSGETCSHFIFLAITGTMTLIITSPECVLPAVSAHWPAGPVTVISSPKCPKVSNV